MRVKIQGCRKSVPVLFHAGCVLRPSGSRESKSFGTSVAGKGNGNGKCSRQRVDAAPRQVQTILQEDHDGVWGYLECPAPHQETTNEQDPSMCVWGKMEYRIQMIFFPIVPSFILGMGKDKWEHTYLMSCVILCEYFMHRIWDLDLLFCINAFNKPLSSL